MKKLTRVKLINWHRFTNDTIEFENSTLISGENGAGKSTLLDAIQFVVLIGRTIRLQKRALQAAQYWVAHDRHDG